PPPAPEPVEPRAEAEVLVVERRAAERVDVTAGRGLPRGERGGRWSGREGGGQRAGTVGEVGAEVGQADGPLTRARAAEAGPLGQLQLAEAAIPHARQALPRRPGARADDAVDGRWRQCVLRRGRPDDADGAV